MKIIAILGSLRKKSYNKQLLEEIIKLTNDSIKFEVFTPDYVPLFNEDIEFPPPESVKILREKIKSCDGILFLSPEYNHSIPGSLRNLLDWLSRPIEKGKGQVLNGIKCAVCGVTPGISGTLNMQDDLMAFLCFVKANIMVKQKIFINDINKYENENGIVDFNFKIDEIKEMVDNFIEFLNNN